MTQYDSRIVTAPDWMENFHCISGECPETCCQQWNIEVDPVHAERFSHLDDPELIALMDGLLRCFRLRRPGMPKPEMQYRLMLTNHPDQRCPLLNAQGECRLQKNYGADMLCDTCYFHPRTFWQIDEQNFLSACLSCPECARLALLHPEPTGFSQFKAEIDPASEWLETELITNPDAQMLLQNRESVIKAMCGLLQERSDPLDERLRRCGFFLMDLAEAENPDADAIALSLQHALEASLPAEDENPERVMSLYLRVFDPIGEGLEKPVQNTAAFLRTLAGGQEGYVRVLAARYAEGRDIAAPFFAEHEYLLENFMVHCVFSDSLKQFFRYQNDSVKSAEILRHEAALLNVWYLLLRVQLAQAALMAQTMDEDLFLKTVIHADKVYFHYPDWFARCADLF